MEISIIIKHVMGENHRGFDELNRKQRLRRQKKNRNKMQGEGFEPPNP